MTNQSQFDLPNRRSQVRPLGRPPGRGCGTGSERGPTQRSRTVAHAKRSTSCRKNATSSRTSSYAAGLSSPITRSAPSSRPSRPHLRDRQPGPRPARGHRQSRARHRGSAVVGHRGDHLGARHGPEAAARHLAKYGVEPIDAMGQPFDPNLHEALMQQPCRASRGDRGRRAEQGLQDPRPGASAQQGGRLGQALSSSRSNAATDEATPWIRATDPAAKQRQICSFQGATDADIRLYLRRLRARVRGLRVDHSAAPDRLPRVQGPQAAPQDRPRRRHPLQGFGVLPDRLSQRLVQEGRQGREVVVRLGQRVQE